MSPIWSLALARIHLASRIVMLVCDTFWEKRQDQALEGRHHLSSSVLPTESFGMSQFHLHRKEAVGAKITHRVGIDLAPERFRGGIAQIFEGQNDLDLPLLRVELVRANGTFQDRGRLPQKRQGFPLPVLEREENPERAYPTPRRGSRSFCGHAPEQGARTSQHPSHRSSTVASDGFPTCGSATALGSPR